MVQALTSAPQARSIVRVIGDATSTRWQRYVVFFPIGGGAVIATARERNMRAGLLVVKSVTILRCYVSRRLFSLAAAALATAVAVVALEWQSTSIGGADQYCYVTAAELLGRGDVSIQQNVPGPPGAEWIWTPIGYTEVPGAPGAIAPICPPGLPLLMAILQRLFRFCAAFWVVPVCAGLTVWFTYLLGDRVFGRSDLGLAAALLVAVSPTFLAQAVSPLTDVPATAAWTLALVLLIGERPVAAGLATAIAIAIRPNLVPTSLALLLWTALRDAGGPHTGRRLAATARVALAFAPAVIAIAWLNAHLFGSPLRSGYGGLENLYSWRHVWTNVRQFTTWTAQTETPVVALATVFFVAPALLPPARIPFARLLLGGLVALVSLSYVFYLPFENWLYLRFLLPMWPIVMLLTAAAFDAVVQRTLPRRIRRAALPVLLGLLTVHHLKLAVNEHVFVRWRDERRYVDVARFIAATADPSAVFVSWQQSGSIRMYAARLTVNFARLDRRSLDRTVDRLRAMGRRPYFVIEGVELNVFRERFAADNRLGSLDWSPIAIFEQPYVAIYDPELREIGKRPTVIPAGVDRSPLRCAHPATWPSGSHSR